MLSYLKYSSVLCCLVAKGLVIVWLLIVGATSGQGCGGTYNASHGRITSPGYPGYPHNVDCTYHIVQPIGYKIQLAFTSFDVEYSSSCDDFLEIIDGTLRTYYCGTRLPFSITSMGDNIWLHFHSDLYVEKTGFAVSYTTEYGDQISYSSWRPWFSPSYQCACIQRYYNYDWDDCWCYGSRSFLCQYAILIPTTSVSMSTSLSTSSTQEDQTLSTTNVTMAIATATSMATIPGTDIQSITSNAVMGTTQITPKKEDGVAGNNGTSLKQGAGIGIGIGIVVGLGLAVIGIVCYCKRIKPGIFAHKSKKRSKSATPVFSNAAYSTASSNLSFNGQNNAANSRSGQMSNNLNNQAPNIVHHNDVYAIPHKNRKLNSPNPEEFVENDFHDEGNSTNPHVILTNNADVDFKPEDEYGVTPVRNGKTGCDPTKPVSTAKNYDYSYVVGQLNLDDVDFEPEDEYGTASGYMEKHEKNKTETDVIFVDNDIYESGGIDNEKIVMVENEIYEGCDM